ncbi:MAG: molybdenum cofactor guanylyltransferase [Candidatus Bathyarchaeia archaeon]
MDKSVIILALDSSNKFGKDKGLLRLDNKPLLKHVIDAVKGISEEVIIVTTSKERADSYAKIVSPKVRFVCDADESKGLLGAALAGFEAAEGKYSLILPFDSPFVSPDVVTLLFDCGMGKSADIARSPDCEVEPLHAVYNTKVALEAAKEALTNGEVDVEAIADRLRGIRYMSTMVIEQLDPDFKTFFRIITPLDLKKAVVMLKPRTSTSKKGAAKAARMPIRRTKRPQL